MVVHHSLFTLNSVDMEVRYGITEWKFCGRKGPAFTVTNNNCFSSRGLTHRYNQVPDQDIQHNANSKKEIEYGGFHSV